MIEFLLKLKENPMNFKVDISLMNWVHNLTKKGKEKKTVTNKTEEFNDQNN